jgi:glycine/D-amino acid oxidase-like deaminating enzyme
VVRARKVVVAAGVGTPRLAAMLGMEVPVRPVRGQNMVTERLPPMLPLPASALRQTAEGVVQIGVTNEEGTWEPATSVVALARMAARAVEVLPPLARARIVRAWGALRPMTPDGYPAYAQSATHPGAFVAVCHSGVTLSAAHAGVLADCILAGRLSVELADMHPARFGTEKNVHAA